MIAWFIRLLKRLVVLLLGGVFVYVAVRKVFPFFDNRAPAALALFATYVFTAYFLIPATARVYRIFVRAKHIPLYCVTPDGYASDPINIGLIGTHEQIESSMQKAGWFTTDKRTIRSLSRMLMALVFRRPYPTAPFSNLYLFGRKQDLGFQKPVGSSPSHRHHVRFWACHLEGPEAFHQDVRFWQRFHRPSRDKSSRQLWVGAASRDIGIVPIRHNAQLTHSIAPDTNAERELIVEDLRNAHKVEKTLTERLGEAYKLRNRAFGGYLHTDGKIRICILK
ncbi:LssY C-terminal domain-containing protein [Candidatus Saccharibacteria bacterium]|nr:LssY C-terminal domain-containing protein [Candidatus Saccharibacteria bacterium]